MYHLVRGHDLGNLDWKDPLLTVPTRLRGQHWPEGGSVSSNTVEINDREIMKICTLPTRDAERGSLALISLPLSP